MISTNSSGQGLKWSPQQSKAEHFAKHPADCLHSEEDFAEDDETRILHVVWSIREIGELMFFIEYI
jgi:hypothetical protein